MVKWYSFRGVAALVLSLALLAAGCTSKPASPAPAPAVPAPAVPAPAPVADRVVKHAMGETKVPGKPQRVIVLDTGELDIALALGVKPVGAVIADAEIAYPAYMKGKTDGITQVGTIDQPNLETITSLKPDLILTNKMRHEKIYDKLSQIAPTVVAERTGYTWKENVKLFAEDLGKTKEANDLMAGYTKRLDKFKHHMGAKLAATKVSVLRSFPDHARIYTNESFIGTILKDAGLPRPKAQDKPGTFVRVTEEQIPDMDGDGIFVMYYGKEKGDSLAKIFKNPLWAGLKAVKEKKVYDIEDGTWGLGLGPMAAQLVIDDLYKFLLK